jgi:hypothetical protein
MPGGVISRVEARDDAMGVEVAKGDVDHCASGLSGKAQSLERGGEDVTHLEAPVGRARETQPHLADEDSFVFDRQVEPRTLVGQPVPETSSEVGAQLLEVHLVVVEEAHHLGLREEASVVIEVVLSDLS